MAEMWTRSPIMQGNTEQHQLALISQLCGSITPEVRGQAAWAPGPHRMQRSRSPPGKGGVGSGVEGKLWRGGWWTDRACSLEPRGLCLSLAPITVRGLGEGI